MLARFHPIVRRWFKETFGKPSDPQREGWPAIASGSHTLILAPTGTGKTLAAFLWELNELIVRGTKEPLSNAVHLLYISPLKALNNDIQRNLERPLTELRERFAAEGKEFPEIRVAVRTGDTPASARARMLRKSPHILITTPESLNIMLTTLKGRGMFSGVRAVIVDCGMTKEMQIAVESPVADLGSIGGSIWPAVAPLVLRHIRASNTTLVFVNNRAQAEKIAARVNTLAEEEIALPYHGSLARERRFALEERLKAGSLRALITTSSLELGIDIGSVDLVIQLQSPKRVAAALQRVGRAGHTLGVPSRGILVPTFRDDALEIAAIVAAMRAGDVEPTHVVQNALDVLAQVVVAAVSVDDWRSEDLFHLVRRAYPYHQLTRGAFDEVAAMLSGKYPSDIAAELEPRITWDRVDRKSTRL